MTYDLATFTAAVKAELAEHDARVPEQRAGLHDHPGIFPSLPGREPDPEMWDLCVRPNEGGPFQTCWEYLLTHELTERERAAFWTAANLVHKAMADHRGREAG